MSGSEKFGWSGNDELPLDFFDLDNMDDPWAHLRGGATMPANSSGMGYQSTNDTAPSFPATSAASQNAYGFGYGYTPQLPEFGSTQYGYRPGVLPDTGVPAANLPMNYGNQFDVQNGYQSSHFQPQPQPQPQPQLPPMPPMPSYGYPSTMPDQMVDFGRTTVDPSQHSVYQQNTTGVENSFGEGEAEGTSPNDEEDEDEADEEEADGSDVDTGDFVVPNTNGSTNVEKPGITREDNGHLEWQHPKTGRWHRAVIHHNIRAALIAQAQAAYPILSYSHPDEAGLGPHDITSFHVDYQDWGFERQDRPKILFQFDAPKHTPFRARPGPLKFQGMVVLNHQNNPVLNWAIPATLSSKTPGWKMEAWKRTWGLTQEDMRARMPRYTFKDVKGTKTRMTLPDKNTIINMSMQRFRDRAGCISWTKRQASDTLRIGIMKLMKAGNFDPTLTNSTEGFGRDLTLEEQKEVKKGNKGQFLSRAGARQVPEDVRRQRQQKEAQKLPTKKVAPPVTDQPSTQNPRKRSRRDDEDEEESDLLEVSQAGDWAMPEQSSRSVRSRKRARTSQEEAPEGEGQENEQGAAESAYDDGEQAEAQYRLNLAQALQASMDAQDGRSRRDQRSTNDLQQTPSLGQLGRTYDMNVGASRSQYATEFDTLARKDIVDHNVSNSTNVAPSASAQSAYQEPPPLTTDNVSRPETSSNRHFSFSVNPQVHRRKLDEFQEQPEDSPSDNMERPQKRQRIIAGLRNGTKTQGNGSLNQAARSQDLDPKIDCRKLKPITDSDRTSLDDALQATREAFFEYTGFHAPRTDRNASYMCQWWHIRRDFESYDWSEQADGQAPYFPQLPPWYTTIREWPPHTKDTMYHEAWKRGHRAPRVGGKLVDLPGDLLERIGKLEERERQRQLDDAVREKGFEPTG